MCLTVQMQFLMQQLVSYTWVNDQLGSQRRGPLIRLITNKIRQSLTSTTSCDRNELF